MPGRVRHLAGARAALYAGGFLGPFGGGVVVVLVPELRDALDISTSAASLALTVYLVPFAVLQLVSGTVGERLGRARAVKAAYVVYALASLGAALASSFGPFLAARAAQGAANAFTTPLVLASLAQSTPDASLGRAMGTFAAVQTAGVVTAPLIGGLAGAVDYRLAFVATAVAAVVLALVPLPGAQPHATAARTAPARLRDALSPRTRWTAAAAFAAYLGVTGVAVVVALRAGDDLGLGPTARGLLLAGFGFAGVLVGRAAGDAADRHGAVAVATAGALPCALLVPLLGIAAAWPALAVAWIAAGVCSALVWAGLNVLTVQAAPANLGGAVSLVGAFKFAGNALAPVAWLPLYARDARLAFAGAGLVSLFIAVAARRAGRAPTA